MQASLPNAVAAIACETITTRALPTLKRPILDGLTLTIAPGEFVALLGLNGAGKSTLLRTIAGLLPIQKGTICINGAALSQSGSRRSELAMLFQGGGLVRQLPAIENVLCGCLGRYSAWQSLGGFSQSDRWRALELLAHLGLKEQAYQRTGNLSGGQQQRVAIARALIQSPKILLADEPTAGLDLLATRQVMESLADLHQQGLTIVAVLHDPALARAYATRVAVLDQGRLVYDGSGDRLPEPFTIPTQNRSESDRP